MVSADAIIQTIGNIVGGTAGAFLGGYFAIKVMKTQMDFHEQQVIAEKNEKFEKAFWLYQASFTGMGNVIKETYEVLNNPAVGDSMNYAYLIGKLNGILTYSSENLSMINDEYIPKHIFPLYVIGKNQFSMCERTINRWTDIYIENDDFTILKDDDDLIDLHNRGRNLIEIIEEIKEMY